MPTGVFVVLDDIADTIDKQEIDDPYTRVLVKGERISWHKGNYLDHRATTLATIGLPGKALQTLHELEKLTERTYRQDETRRFAWLDILEANIYMGLEEFGSATKCTTQALLTCQDISSVTNIAIITDIYGRLLKSRASRDVQELGDLLRESPVNFLEPEE